ncbi:hypothetical protein NJ7G_2258 [Natrinema sp. J7-2]|nr:hypothetical protein NJ7G_2258 [Natrinema sp. J7-2]
MYGIRNDDFPGIGSNTATTNRSPDINPRVCRSVVQRDRQKIH